MTELLDGAFDLVCGRDPAHCSRVDGELLPLCQRCVGIYVGVTLAILWHAAIRPRATRGSLWIHALLLAQIVPQGLYLIPQNPLLRGASGVLFACGLVRFLWLVPPLSRSSDDLREPRVRWRTTAYWIAVATSAVAVPLLASSDVRAAVPVLLTSAVLGVLGASTLALLNAIVAGRRLFHGN